MLGRTGFLDIAHAAMDLDAQRGDLDADIGRPGFRYRRQQFLAALGRGALVGVLCVLGHVRRHGAGHADGPRGRDLGFHQRQGALDIRVMDDGVRRRALGIDGTALLAVLGIGQRLLESALGNADALHADIQTRRIHHREHAAHAGILTADQPAGRAGIFHGAGRRAVNAQLVLDPDGTQIVARAVRQDFRHDEERDTLRTLGRARRPREHQMDDVLRAVVFAPGDEDLLAGDRPAAVRIRFGPGAQRAHIRSGLRLGEVHRGRPLAGEQLAQIQFLLLVSAVSDQRLDPAIGEHRAETEGQVGALDHFQHGHAQRARQTHTAQLGRELQPLPAAFDELRIGRRKAGRRGDGTILELAVFGIADAIERREHILGQLGRLFQNGRRQIGGEIREGTRRLQPLNSRYLFQREAHFIQRCAICHGRPPSSFFCGRNITRLPADANPETVFCPARDVVWLFGRADSGHIL